MAKWLDMELSNLVCILHRPRRRLQDIFWWNLSKRYLHRFWTFHVRIRACTCVVKLINKSHSLRALKKNNDYYFFRILSINMNYGSNQKFCCVKGEGEVDHSTITKWIRKFRSACKNLDDQARSGWFKSIDSEAVLQAIKINPSNSVN